MSLAPRTDGGKARTKTSHAIVSATPKTLWLREKRRLRGTVWGTEKNSFAVQGSQTLRET